MLANNKNLTTPERMRLLRSRTGLTQDELADVFCVTKYKYRQIETGDSHVPDDLTRAVQAYIAQNWTSDATAHELLRIERERAGYTTIDAANVVGYSRSMWMIVEGGGRPYKSAPEFQQVIYNHATARKTSAG